MLAIYGQGCVVLQTLMHSGVAPVKVLHLRVRVLNCILVASLNQVCCWILLLSHPLRRWCTYFCHFNGVVQDTYRYHGHSISDPGSTYRTRDEISGIRRARDPIEHIKTLLTEHGFAEGADLKKREKQIKREVCCSVMKLCAACGCAASFCLGRLGLQRLPAKHSCCVALQHVPANACACDVCGSIAKVQSVHRMLPAFCPGSCVREYTAPTRTVFSSRCHVCIQAVCQMRGDWLCTVIPARYPDTWPFSWHELCS